MADKTEILRYRRVKHSYVHDDASGYSPSVTGDNVGGKDAMEGYEIDGEFFNLGYIRNFGHGAKSMMVSDGKPELAETIDFLRTKLLEDENEQKRQHGIQMQYRPKYLVKYYGDGDREKVGGYQINNSFFTRDEILKKKHLSSDDQHLNKSYNDLRARLIAYEKTRYKPQPTTKTFGPTGPTAPGEPEPKLVRVPGFQFGNEFVSTKQMLDPEYIPREELSNNPNFMKEFEQLRKICLEEQAAHAHEQPLDAGEHVGSSSGASSSSSAGPSSGNIPTNPTESSREINSLPETNPESSVPIEPSSSSFFSFLFGSSTKQATEQPSVANEQLSVANEQPSPSTSSSEVSEPTF